MRKITLLVAMTALAVLLSALPAHASTFTVNSNQDAPDANAGDGVCATEASKCTLRAAIQEANALEGDDTVGFASKLEGTTITLGGEQLTISSNINIEGLGAEELAVSGNDSSRVFFIEQGSVVEIEGLTIKDGNSAGFHGGGIRNQGTTTLRLSVISGNRTSNVGGGIFNEAAGTLTVLRSTISGNSADHGGGIFNDDTLKVRRSTISGNSADEHGGGIFNHFGTAKLTNSTISGNSADQNGGGILTFEGTLTVTNSTFAGNSAGSAGGGIFIEPESVVNLSNTIIANSTQGGNCFSETFRVILNDSGYNISSDSTCPFSEPTSLSDTNPKLKGLANNGGPTKTHALRDESPAINLIPNGENGCGDVPESDQRGVKRPQGNKCDTGSFEKKVVRR